MILSLTHPHSREWRNDRHKKTNRSLTDFTTDKCTKHPPTPYISTNPVNPPFFVSDTH